MSDIIDINVGETIEEVTINVTDNLITVNINKVTGGGGGTQTLAQTLDLGNSTGGSDILLNNDDAIVLENNSSIRKGTYDFGQNGGVSRICGVDYEDMWQGGIRHVFDNNGFIRNSTNGFNTVPNFSFDASLRFKIGSFWTLDDGTTYICTDATVGAAVWEIYSVGATPTLQQVTDEGNTTTNDVKVNSLGLYSNDVVDYGYLSWTDDLGLSFKNHTTQEVFNVDKNSNSLSFINDNDFKAKIQSAISDNRFYQLPDADGTFALTTDIPAAQVNSDWNATSGVEEILNKPTIPDTSTFVPYTGATADVDLGEYGLLTGNIEFDNTPTNIPTAAGSMYYNDSDGTLDLILKGGNVKLQIGQEQVVRVVNKTATNINLLEANYQAVRVTGAQGQRLKVDLALATTDALSAETIGIVTETINNNQEGFVTTSGLVRNINTTGSLQGETWADGDILYLSPTTAGNVTKVKPTAANHLIVIGYVIYAHATQGTIFVKVDNGYELDELHNVFIDTPLNNQGLVYETSTSLWKNKTIDKTFVGLGNVDNTSDANKPVSTAQQTAIDAKVADSITDGVTTIAPSQNAVFDALALKQNALAYTPFKFVQTSQTAHTGTVAETIIATATINGGTFNSSDVMKVLFKTTKSNTSSVAMRLKINTTNTLVGATQIGLFNFTTLANTYVLMTRTFDLNGGNLFGYNFNSSLVSDVVNVNTPGNSTAYNTANTLYLFFTLQNANVVDTVTPNLCNITN
jgi:hypothetical protein